MTAQPPREFASAILVDTCGRLLLQLRDDVPGILYPGFVGLFGGHREGDETFLECVCREVHEETSFRVAPDRFEHMGSYSGSDPGGRRVLGEFFITREIPVDALRITEGSLLIAQLDQLPELAPRLVPSALSAVRIFASGGSL